MKSQTKRNLGLIVLLSLIVFNLSFSISFAEGTGDDPAPTEDVLTKSEALKKAKDEAQYQEWLEGKKVDKDGLGALTLDMPYKFI